MQIDSKSNRRLNRHAQLSAHKRSFARYLCCHFDLFYKEDFFRAHVMSLTPALFPCGSFFFFFSAGCWISRIVASDLIFFPLNILFFNPNRIRKEFIDNQDIFNHYFHIPIRYPFFLKTIFSKGQC